MVIGWACVYPVSYSSPFSSMAQDFHAETVKKMAALERTLEPVFTKAPHLPENVRLGLVSIVPWAALIFGIMGILGLLSAGAFMSVISLSFYSGGITKLSWAIVVLAGLLTALLELLAYKPLTKREKKGWNFLFYGVVLTILAAIIDLIFGYGSGATGSIVGSLIGLWLLFEIRTMYR